VTPDSLERRLPAEVSVLCEAFERSPDAVVVTDRRNRIVYSNRTAEALLGFSDGETVGLSCDAVLKGRDVFDNRYCALNCPVMQMAVRGEGVRDFRLRVEARDGGEITVELSVLQLVVAAPEHYYLERTTAVVGAEIQESRAAFQTCDLEHFPRTHLLAPTFFRASVMGMHSAADRAGKNAIRPSTRMANCMPSVYLSILWWERRAGCDSRTSSRPVFPK